jgi:HYR domain-containing protein
VVLLLASEMNNAEAILIEPDESTKYQIKWTWDSNSSRYVGLIKPKIRIADESHYKIVGYVADENGTRLRMYNDEQVVMAKYYLDHGFTSDWEIADRPEKGYFAISIPPEYVGKVQSIKIFINNHQYSINDGTSTTSQSWVFINSAQHVHKLGSLIHLGPLTLGLENLPYAAIPLNNDSYDDLKDNDKFNVNVFDKRPPIFMTQPHNVIIRFDNGLPIVWYELPLASDYGGQTLSIVCNPPPGSIFNFGTNIVKCVASYDPDDIAYSYFAIEVAKDPNTSSSDQFMQAQIDIDPFYPGNNDVKLRYTTLVSVAIFGNMSLNLREMDQNTLHFGPNGVLPASTGSYMTDVNADGIDDLVVKFDVLEAGLYEGYSGDACLMGVLDDGKTAFEGCDFVNIMRK